MDDSHKMIAGRELRGTLHEVEGLLVEAIWLTVNEYRHRPETLPARRRAVKDHAFEPRTVLSGERLLALFSDGMGHFLIHARDYRVPMVL